MYVKVLLSKAPTSAFRSGWELLLYISNSLSCLLTPIKATHCPPQLDSFAVSLLFALGSVLSFLPCLLLVYTAVLPKSVAQTLHWLATNTGSGTMQVTYIGDPLFQAHITGMAAFKISLYDNNQGQAGNNL